MTTELGKIKFGEPHSFTVELQNDTDKPIDIDRIAVGCSSCTKVHSDTWYVDIGEKIIIDVIFTPGALGIQTKKIYVFHNDGEIEIKFKSNVHE